MSPQLLCIPVFLMAGAFLVLEDWPINLIPGGILTCFGLAALIGRPEPEVI